MEGRMSENYRRRAPIVKGKDLSGRRDADPGLPSDPAPYGLQSAAHLDARLTRQLPQPGDDERVDGAGHVVHKDEPQDPRGGPERVVASPDVLIVDRLLQAAVTPVPEVRGW